MIDQMMGVGLFYQFRLNQIVCKKPSQLVLFTLQDLELTTVHLGVSDLHIAIQPKKVLSGFSTEDYMLSKWRTESMYYGEQAANWPNSKQGHNYHG